MWQIQIHHINFKFTTANSNSLQEIQIDRCKFKFAKFVTANSTSLGKFKFTAANPNVPHQIQIHHCKFEFTAPISNSLQQTHHSKFKFTKAKKLPGKIQIHNGKFKFTPAISNSPWQIIEVIKANYRSNIKANYQ